MVKAYLGFMDHSVSEQLNGTPSLWHTSVLLLSEGTECSDLAKAIATIINPLSKRLKKWSQTKGGRYRKNFCQQLMAALPRSGVMIFATSAREITIESNKDHVIRELDLINHYKTQGQQGQTVRVRIGPLTDSTGQDHFFELPENRAVMVLWIAHFTCRMHTYLAGELKKTVPNLFSVDWLPIYVDKFAGDNVHAFPSMQLFQSVVTHHILRSGLGNVRVAFFHEKDADRANVLADNVAGLFNESKNRPSTYSDLPALIQNGCIYWESGN